MKKPLVYLNITHNDLDGIWSAIAVKLAHTNLNKNIHVKTVFSDYGDIDEKFLEALTRGNLYKRIIISDITFTPNQDKYTSGIQRKNAELKIPEAIKSYVSRGGEVVILDHHERALKIKEQYKEFIHSSSILEVFDSGGVPRAGSELAARYYASQIKNTSKIDEVLIKYCEIAGEYDTWRSPHGYGGLLAMASQVMNDPYLCMREFENSLSLICLDSFRGVHQYNEKAYLEKLAGTTISKYIEYVREDYQKSLEEAMKTCRIVLSEPVKVCEVYAPKYGSMISDYIYNNDECIVLIKYNLEKEKMNKLSLRCNKGMGINLAEFAALYGGGGHSSAAALPIKNNKIEDIIESLRRYIIIKNT